MNLNSSGCSKASNLHICHAFHLVCKGYICSLVQQFCVLEIDYTWSNSQWLHYTISSIHESVEYCKHICRLLYFIFLSEIHVIEFDLNTSCIHHNLKKFNLGHVYMIYDWDDLRLKYIILYVSTTTVWISYLNLHHKCDMKYTKRNSKL